MTGAVEVPAVPARRISRGSIERGGVHRRNPRGLLRLSDASVAARNRNDEADGNQYPTYNFHCKSLKLEGLVGQRRALKCGRGVVLSTYVREMYG